jgi:hypothetical protein
MAEWVMRSSCAEADKDHLLAVRNAVLDEQTFLRLTASGKLRGDDPARVDWDAFERGEPYPYSTDGFTEQAAKRIVLCQA